MSKEEPSIGAQAGVEAIGLLCGGLPKHDDDDEDDDHDDDGGEKFMNKRHEKGQISTPRARGWSQTRKKPDFEAESQRLEPDAKKARLRGQEPEGGARYGKGQTSQPSTRSQRQRTRARTRTRARPHARTYARGLHRKSDA